eukprot:XP_001703690.1 predicted protein [Chlamydomonas reinhardtii]
MPRARFRAASTAVALLALLLVVQCPPSAQAARGEPRRPRVSRSPSESERAALREQLLARAAAAAAELRPPGDPERLAAATADGAALLLLEQVVPPPPPPHSYEGLVAPSPVGSHGGGGAGPGVDLAAPWLDRVPVSGAFAEGTDDLYGRDDTKCSMPYYFYGNVDDESICGDLVRPTNIGEMPLEAWLGAAGGPQQLVTVGQMLVFMQWVRWLNTSATGSRFVSCASFSVQAKSLNASRPGDNGCDPLTYTASADPGPDADTPGTCTVNDPTTANSRLDYNYLTATAQFQGDSPYASCEPAVTGALVDTLSGLQAAVYGALQSGGLAGVCPLGLLAGSWAVTGAVVRALAAPGGAFPNCQPPFAIIGAAIGGVVALAAAAAAYMWWKKKQAGFNVSASAEPGMAERALPAIRAAKLPSLADTSLSPSAKSFSAGGHLSASGLFVRSPAAPPPSPAAAPSVAPPDLCLARAAHSRRRRGSGVPGSDSPIAEPPPAAAGKASSLPPIFMKTNAAYVPPRGDAGYSGGDFEPDPQFPAASGPSASRAGRAFKRPGGGHEGEWGLGVWVEEEVVGGSRLRRTGLPEDAPDGGGGGGSEHKPPSRAGSQTGAGHRSVRQFRFADTRAGRSIRPGDVDFDDEDELLDGGQEEAGAGGRQEALPENATEEERRAHAMRHARTGAFGDVGRIGPVDNIQLQREMRRRALLEQMKNNAWAGSFAPQREPGPGPAGGDA